MSTKKPINEGRIIAYVYASLLICGSVTGLAVLLRAIADGVR